MAFNRDDYYILTDLSRYLCIDYAPLDCAFLNLCIAPDIKRGKNRYWKKDRFEAIKEKLNDAGYQPQDKRLPGSNIRIDANFFDFDPIPAYFRRYEDDEV